MELVRSDWTTESIDFGKGVFDFIPVTERVNWAASILIFISDQLHSEVCISDLIEVTFDESRWLEAENIFHSIRGRTIENERKKRYGAIDQLVLDIAELTAKITFNATKVSAPFDKDVGWYVAPALKRICVKINVPDFEEKCWSLLLMRDKESV